MSENADAAAPTPQPDSVTAHDERGGVEHVLASLRTLDDLPVAEHVGVFERAHEQLRRALDAPRTH